MKTLRHGYIRGPLTFKQHLLIITIAAFLFSLIFTAVSIKSDSRMMDHPLSSDEYSFSEMLTLGCYTLSLLHVPVLLIVATMYSVFLRVIRLTGVQFDRIEKFPVEAIFLIAILILAHAFSSFCFAFVPFAFLSILVLTPFYYLLPALVFSKYRYAARERMVHKPVLLGILCLVGILVSSNNLRGLSGIAEDGVKLSVVFFTIAGCIFVINYDRFANVVLDPSEKRLSAGAKRLGWFVSGLLVGIILLTFAFSFLSFLRERREEEIPSGEESSSPALSMNVVLVVIDALRADHLGCYGYHRNTTPNIDSFAEESVLFENCYSQASWTKPSVASIFTSLYPLMHGAVSRKTSILPDEVTTVAEILKDKGYLTYGYVANPNVKAMFNYDQGFDCYDDYLMRDKLYYAALRNLRRGFPWLRRMTKRRFNFSDRDNAKLANSRIIPWLQRNKDNSCFAYIHYMDPHDPYSPPSPYDSMYSHIEGDGNSRNISLYDGEIRFNDEHLGRLLGKLKDWGIYEKSLIVLTSDHGEAFGEHNDTIHGRTIYNELLKVPLIIKYPQSQHKGMRIEQQVRSIDILPTILEAGEISDGSRFEGRSVSALLANADAEFCGHVYVDNDVDGVFVHDGIIEANTWKYIYTEKSPLRDVRELGHEELYNLKDDPKELQNLIEQGGEISVRMRDKLGFYRKRCSERRLKPLQTPLDAETIRNLKSLGYLE